MSASTPRASAGDTHDEAVAISSARVREFKEANARLRSDLVRFARTYLKIKTEAFRWSLDRSAARRAYATPDTSPPIDPPRDWVYISRSSNLNFDLAQPLPGLSMCETFSPGQGLCVVAQSFAGGMSDVKSFPPVPFLKITKIKTSLRTILKLLKFNFDFGPVFTRLAIKPNLRRQTCQDS